MNTSFDSIQCDSANFSEREAYDAQREADSQPAKPVKLSETDYHFDIAQDNWLP